MGIAGVPPIREDEFTLFQRLIRHEAGINLGPHKKALLVSRLYPRLRALRARTFTEYYLLVTGDDGGLELSRMLDCITTNETSFFRERLQFEHLAHEICPAWAQEEPRRIRVWSAACATGEEPYSVAMTLLYHLPIEGFSVEILASDLSTRALERARQATWPIDRAADIPPSYLHAFMLEGSGAQRGKMKAGPAVRQVVRFARINLNEDPHPNPGLFDAIFCRNVMIYFNAETRAAVIARLLSCLRPRGYLFLGHAETLHRSVDRLESVMPAVYRCRGTWGTNATSDDERAARPGPPRR